MNTPVEWQWFGHAGHFVGASECLFILHTRIGNYRISTIGDYYPHRAGENLGERRNIGASATHETMVFRVKGAGSGKVRDWGAVQVQRYDIPLSDDDDEPARAGHLAMCEKYAALTAREQV